LRYGTSEFRLPDNILERQIDEIKSLGVEVKTNIHMGQAVTLNKLFIQGFSSVLLAVGAGKPHFPDIPGIHWGGVCFAEEFLMRINSVRPTNFKNQTRLKLGEKIVVVGKGRSAIECARVCARLGKNVSLLFKETEEDIDVHWLNKRGFYWKV